MSLLKSLQVLVVDDTSVSRGLICMSLEEIGIKTVLSGVHVHLETMLANEGFFDVIPSEHLYKSVHDALVCLQEFDSQYNHFTIDGMHDQMS